MNGLRKVTDRLIVRVVMAFPFPVLATSRQRRIWKAFARRSGRRRNPPVLF
jgi:hypothetical protein